MIQECFKFKFNPAVPMDHVEDSLKLAVFAVASLYGDTQVRLDGCLGLNHKARICIVDATTGVGQSVARIFTGFLKLEFGEESFEVTSYPSNLIKSVTNE